MGKKIHILSEVDRDARTAVCANCGPVKVWYASGKRLMCSVAKRERARSAPSYGRSRMKRPHGLTVDEARAYLEGRSCGICGSTKRGTGGLGVDHDHETGHIRGALCARCNIGIGNFLDDPELLKKAIEYLVSSRQEQGK